MSSRRPATPEEKRAIYAVCAKLGTDPRTVRGVMAGSTVRGALRELVRSELTALGHEPPAPRAITHLRGHRA